MVIFLQNLHLCPSFPNQAIWAESQDSGGLFFLSGLLYRVMGTKMEINDFNVNGNEYIK